VHRHAAHWTVENGAFRFASDSLSRQHARLQQATASSFETFARELATPLQIQSAGFGAR